MHSKRFIGGNFMKCIIFIDDIEQINKLQKSELEKILLECNIDDLVKIETNTISLKSNEFQDFEIESKGDSTYLKNNIKSISKQIQKMFKSGAEKVELVIDLCLDDNNPITGILLAKRLVNKDDLQCFFEENKLLITLTSAYISADFEVLSNSVLCTEEAEKVLYCHRPIFDNEFEKKRYAFPEYYVLFMERISNADIKKLLLEKTYYGNYFGMLLARLLCEEK